ncbi:MAG: hypothetical protein ACJ8FB_02950 [Sphingomicrobium sp.]
MLTFEKALRGELGHNYYLASLDPGQGKSLAVATFVKCCADLGYKPDEGILIGVSRLSEIETLVAASGLKPTEFGVLTAEGNMELNALGLPEERHRSARVLFTTQQMIVRRCAGQQFDQTTAFYYDGKPRKLRVWDETLTPAEGFTVGRDSLGQLLAPLRLERNDYAAAVEELMERLAAAEHRQRVFVPLELAVAPRSMDWSTAGPTDDQRKLVENLARLAGREALVVSDGGCGNTLVGVERSLPSDFAPAIVLDASGRVRPTYSIWSDERRDLVRLPPAESDYTNVRIHLWQQASGRGALRNRETRKRVVTGLAEAINRDPESRWLIISYKSIVQFPSELLAHIIGDPSRVRFITWGNHHGTNEYRDVRNVALVGQFTYPRSSYVAFRLAAGLPEGRIGEREATFKEGELAHHTLQAALRGSARKVVNGKASPMQLFIVASPSPSLPERLKRIFPGSSLDDWEPWPKDLRGHAKALAEYLSERFASGGLKVRKGEARLAAGIPYSGNLRPILKNRAFIGFMEEREIRSVGQFFVRADDSGG